MSFRIPVAFDVRTQGRNIYWKRERKTQLKSCAHHNVPLWIGKHDARVYTLREENSRSKSLAGYEQTPILHLDWTNFGLTQQENSIKEKLLAHIQTRI